MPVLFSNPILRRPFVWPPVLRKAIRAEYSEYVLRAILREDELLLSAIQLSARELPEKLHAWFDDLRPNPRMRSAIYRYLMRYCARATPFGLFAGVCTGDVREEVESSSLDLKDGLPLINVRIDHATAKAIGNYLAKSDANFRRLKAVRAGMAVGRGDRLEVYNPAKMDNTSHDVVSVGSVRRSDLLDMVLRCAEHPVSLAELENKISEARPQAASGALAYLRLLVEERLLVVELDGLQDIFRCS